MISKNKASIDTFNKCINCGIKLPKDWYSQTCSSKCSKKLIFSNKYCIYCDKLLDKTSEYIICNDLKCRLKDRYWEEIGNRDFEDWFKEYKKQFRF